MERKGKRKEEKMNVGDIVHAVYDNGEVVDGEVVSVRDIKGKTLLTVKCKQGYRSIYIDQCVKFFTLGII